MNGELPREFYACYMELQLLTVLDDQTNPSTLLRFREVLLRLAALSNNPSLIVFRGEGIVADYEELGAVPSDHRLRLKILSRIAELKPFGPPLQ